MNSELPQAIALVTMDTQLSLCFFCFFFTTSALTNFEKCARRHSIYKQDSAKVQPTNFEETKIIKAATVTCDPYAQKKYLMVSMSSSSD